MTAFRSFAIVPAAGVSARMGRHKLLLPWRGTSVVEQVLATWRLGGVSQLFLVARAEDAVLIEYAQRAGAEVIAADPPPIDMKASIQIGLDYVAAHWQPQIVDVWLTAPADLPTLSAETIRSLIGSHAADSPRVLVASHRGRRGHPVLFPWSVAAKVAELPADAGLNLLIEQSSPVMIECGEGALCADLDTPTDYERLRG
jgi:molybdenum cofactor cytidylyltransferase